MTTPSGRADAVHTAGPLPSDEDIAAELLDFLAERTRTRWEPDQDLFAVGGMSSLFAMQLVVHLEQTHQIAISGADLMLDNFRTVEAMVRLVNKLRGSASASGSTGE
ncbi:acyl carrier protein [Streptomyces tibetensis]|uniref:Acyl carrier protein n=1 Tax=Streptomyces thermotolerans TaxID=80858 RepID=A0A0P0KHK6_STRTH|nr:acyl carrier protein [Streptomyces thermotolerans]